MLGTVVNSVSIIVGSVLGVFLKEGIKGRYKETIMQGMSLVVMLIGIMGAVESKNILLVIISLALGSIIGEKINIEEKLDKLGSILENKLGKNNSSFAEGFVTSSLVFCIGAMAIVGALESGLQGNSKTLFAKSVIDGISSIIFASTMGIGVAFSSVCVFLYQGIITVLASEIKGYLTADVIREMSAVGGLLVFAIGLNMMEIKKIRVGNMLPAIFVPLIYHILSIIFTGLRF